MTKWLPTPAQAKELLKRGIIEKAQYDIITATAKEKKAKGLKGMYVGGRVEGEGYPSDGKVILAQQQAAADRQSLKLQQRALEEELAKKQERAKFFGLTDEEKAQYLPQTPQPAPAEPVLEPVPALAQQNPIDPNIPEPTAPGPKGSGGLEASLAGPLAVGTQGYDQQQLAVAQAAKVEEAKAKELEAQVAQSQKEDQKRIEEIERQRQEDKKRFDDSQAELFAEADRLGAMEVDPKRYWNNKTTGDKILANIGIFLGSVGASMQGLAENPVLKRIQNDIDRDIEAQKGAISQKGKAFDVKRGLYEDRANYYKNDILAKESTRLAYLNNAQLKVEQIAARYKGPEARANAAKLWGGLQVQKDAAIAAFNTEMLKLIGKEKADLTEDQRKRYVPGYGLVNSPEARERTQKLNEVKMIAEPAIDRLVAMTEQSFSSMPSDEKADAEITAKGLIGTLKDSLLGAGVLSGPDMKFLDEMIANPTSLFSLSSRNKTRLMGLKRLLREKVEGTFKAGGGVLETERRGVTAREE